MTQQGPAPFSASVAVEAVWPISHGFRRIAMHGADLDAYTEIWPADAFKLMLPPDGGRRVDFPSRDGQGMPYWPEGTKQPLLRAYTVRSFDAARQRIEFDVALHGQGVAMAWLNSVQPGDGLGISGMRREFYASPDVDRHLIIGDASALPAVAAIVESLPRSVPVVACLAAADESDKQLLPAHENLTAQWVIGHAQSGKDSELERLVRDVVKPQGRTQAWLAGEAAATRELRRFVLDECDIARADMQAGAYWKAGTDSTAVDADKLGRYQRALADGADITEPDVVDSLEFER